MAMMKFAVPMKRANCSLQTPKVSWDTVGRGRSGRLVSRGWSRRALLARAVGRSRSAMGHLATLLAPVVGENVVEHVVHRDGAEKPAVVVDHRHADEVVGRQDARDLSQR